MAHKETVGVNIRVRKSNQELVNKTFTNFPIVFGRGENCHLSLEQFSFISRNHGCIYVEGNDLVITDLDSRNGLIFQNEKKTIFRSNKQIVFYVGDIEFIINKVEQEAVKTLTSYVYASDEKTVIAKKTIPSVKPQQTHARAFEGIEPEVRDSGLRAVLFWKSDVHDISHFIPGDQIIVGKNQSDALVLPTCVNKINLGRVGKNQAQIIVPRGLKWSGQSVRNEVIKSQPIHGGTAVSLYAGNKLQIDFGHECTIEFSFSEITRPFVKRTWIENKEEFNHAISISGVIHFMICIGLLVFTPKPEAPKIPNMEPRFAKLLVQPPKQVFAPPPPPPPPSPAPEPEPMKKAEPPPVVKQMPKKKIPVAKAPKALPTKTKTVAASNPAPSKPSPQPSKPAPTEAEKLMSALDSFAAAPTTSAVNVKNLKVAANVEKTFSTNQLTSSLKSKTGTMAPTPTGTMSESFAKSTNTNYRNIASEAGSRAVAAKVGKVQFGGVQGPQGLTDKEVMSAVNKHVGEIQQCYERSLLDNSSLSGRVEYEWTIAPAGRVTDAHVKRSEVSGGDSLNECVMKVLRGIQFPAAKNGQQTVVSVGFPFGRR